ncbi:uncharacterized protein PgNI_00209 [Pyricularia grisea]|uniref:Uncharacterized protein n=1 Tax=Pyricularia grisea TaxID=148305 RepID=A0A6P8BHL8_PYRGI|nr:uncharacterized protein PgNI_00209 [Pyricularia grisea]TLD16104.1 hypothetical protein PgNI_00209 [Pyricularia grisea]
MSRDHGKREKGISGTRTKKVVALLRRTGLGNQVNRSETNGGPNPRA